jgi:gamma-glutamylcyclotransferase
MSTDRLRERVPSARPLGVGSLKGYSLRFHKRSKDGTGKCDIVPTGDSREEVLGVVFEIEPQDVASLRRAEGTGYEEKDVEVVTSEGPTRAFTYRARPEWIDPALRPASWYKELLIRGAVEHHFPQFYVEKLQSVRIDNGLRK